ncbi:FG-GAP repeat domain-containing protein [Arundinibacter roseus]|uniref:VCBS repeat-containing protein n=1 Tax=Arundinibacter roseus TaxID=2070510 RepID=A0A4R4KHG0_9BACT|nr:VCBS repeat-containing protein [Arundinibacter roseus]TDB66081.1 VCBS repeat-containing protein [Arundinibacter roseus]
MNISFPLFRLPLLLIFAGSSLILSCTQDHTPTEADAALATQHCTSCHAFAGPELLPRDTWEKSVLPYMALRMGVKSEIAEMDSLNELELQLEPPKPLISEEDWARIKNYYLALAPEKLEEKTIPPLEMQRGQFELKRGQLFSEKMTNISCVKIDPERQVVYACDDANGEIWALSPGGLPKNRYGNQLAVSNIELTKKGLLVTYIGPSVGITVHPNGFSQLVDVQENAAQNANLMLTKLYRPTQTLPVDLNNDGLEELVTCEFGVIEGSFSVWYPQTNGTYRKKILSPTPGAIRAEVVDWDRDGRKDLVVLFAQGDERLMLYRNTGNDTFEEKMLMRFPPVYGSSYFELADLNGDGRLDILYTCGDNADYSRILKPYHGVYAFEQKPDGDFRQKFHFPLHGAYKAVARDFDGDGDQDIVAIAYFGHYDSKTPNDLVYLENREGKFAPQLLPGIGRGRWMCLDAADLDGDGDDDIALGSHPVGLMPGGFRKDWSSGPGVIFLINQQK